MFHAELAYKNVQNEIALLTQKKGERQAALIKSQDELKEDHGALLAFIAADNKEKKDKELKEKQANAKRQEREEALKKVDMEIQQVRSDIEKHKDALNDLQMNQRFILELSPLEFRQQREARVKQKKEKALKEWLAKIRGIDMTEEQMHIVFSEDEEIHDNIKIESIDDSNQLTVKKGKQDEKRKTKRSKDNVSDQWLAQRFEQLLRLDLIELPDDYYEDKLFFDDTNALDQKFTQLEEDNLFYIHRIQDIE